MDSFAIHGLERNSPERLNKSSPPERAKLTCRNIGGRLGR